MRRKLIPIIVGLAALPAMVAPARATNYQDLWWNPNESGWGVQIVQQEDTLFLTWFIYDAAGKPVWVVSDSVTRLLVPPPQGTTIYRGRVARATGTYFGAPWGGFTPIEAGPPGSTTVTLTFTDSKSGTLSYTIDGVSVTKPITRQTLKIINLSARYYGGISRDASGCQNAALNGSAIDSTSYSITHNAANSTSTSNPITIAEIGVNNCQFTGSVQQYGSVFEGNGRYTCASGLGGTGAWTGRDGTGGEANFSMRMSIRPDNDICTVTATLGGFKQ